MNGDTYKFDSTAEIRLTKLLGLPGLTTPTIRLHGPTVINRSDSSAPAPGRFLAKTTIKEMNLTGKVLGREIHVTLNGDYLSEGTIEGRADPNSSNPNKPEPLGQLKSNFKVYVTVTTPFGILFNADPVEMRARIDSVPPKLGRYRQYSPPRDLFEKAFNILAAQMQCAVHVVRNPISGFGGKPGLG